MSCADDFSPVTLDAPESVELFAHEQSGKNNLVVCLVNTFGAVSRSSGKILWSAGKVQNSLFRFDEIEEMPVIAEATIHLKKHDAKKIKRVYLAPEEKEVEFDETNDHVTVKIRNLTVYTMLVVEYI